MTDPESGALHVGPQPSPTPAPVSPAPRSRGLRFATVSRDVVLVVLGALLALAVDEWREARQRRDRVQVTLASIREEMRANSARVIRSRDRHLFLVDTLQKIQAASSLPGPAVWSNGMSSPAQVTSTAWIVARETGALGDIPVATVLVLASVYEMQESYAGVAQELEHQVMNDVRRDGMEVVLRDRFVQFIPLAVDFSGRERRLLARYEKALALPELK